MSKLSNLRQKISILSNFCLFKIQVITKKCGDRGKLKCIAKHDDGSEAPITFELLEDGFYRVHILPSQVGHLSLHFEFEEDNDDHDDDDENKAEPELRI